MIGIIDYNAGNIRSVEHALNHLGIENRRSGSVRDLEKADRLIFPGDGNAGYAMDQLHRTGLGAFLQDAAARGTPILGVCVGAQIIFDYSEESDIECLALLPGAIRHLKQVWLEREDASAEAKAGILKVPHMGWNPVRRVGEGTGPGKRGIDLFQGIAPDTPFYFVHSYIICPKNPDIVTGTADFGVPVPAVLQAGNVMATQFHPEKSGEAGLRMLRNFCQGTFEAA